MNKPTVVCLCGSTRFSQEFHDANLRETLAGRIVLSIGVDTKSDTDLMLTGEITMSDKQRLDELHLRKIDLADEVLVLNVGGYIGESTSREIAYATASNKPIRYLEDGSKSTRPPLPTSAMAYATITLAHLRVARDYLAKVTKKLDQDNESDPVVLTGLEATKANLACTIQHMEDVLHRLICAGGTQP